jgi:hypothetical protein
MIKNETVIVNYGAKSGMIGGRFGIMLDGTQSSYRTFKTKETAESKALEMAQHIHKDFYQDINETNYHFEFQLVS